MMCIQTYDVSVLQEFPRRAITEILLNIVLMESLVEFFSHPVKFANSL